MLKDRSRKVYSVQQPNISCPEDDDDVSPISVVFPKLAELAKLSSATMQISPPSIKSVYSVKMLDALC